MAYSYVINDFTHGEIAPWMLSRSDLKIYKRSAEKLRNVLVKPSGGVKKRFGTEFLTAYYSVDDNKIKLVGYDYFGDKKFLIVLTNNQMDIYDGDTKVKTFVTDWSGDDIKNNLIKHAQSGSEMIFCNEDSIPKVLRRKRDGTWEFTGFDFKNEPAYDYNNDYDDITFELSTNTVGNPRILTASDSVFNSNHEGGRFVGFSDTEADIYGEVEGVANITEFVSDTSVKVDITSKFSGQFTSGVKGKKCILQEVAFSDDHGYPTSVTFYQNRLIFGGGKDLPQTVFMSVVGQFRDFNVGSGQPSDAIVIKLGGAELTKIKNVVSDKTLQIFTSRSEHAAIQENGTALNLNSLYIRKQTNNGISNVSPAVLDNQTFYIKRNGRGMMSYAFNPDNSSYNSTEVSIIAGHLIRSPIDMSALNGAQLEDSSYLLVCNDDGTLAVYQTTISQNVSAWSLCTTDGEFVRVQEVDEELYFIIKREIDGDTRYYIERADFTEYLDCAHHYNFGSETTNITGLDALEGKEVSVKGDGFVLKNETVVGGEISISRPSKVVSVGLSFNSKIKPTPFAVTTQDTGATTYKKKRLHKAYVDYYESLGVKVDDILIPYLTFDEDVFSNSNNPRTGIYETTISNGWDARNMIEVSSDYPLPMFIIGIGFDIGF